MKGVAAAMAQVKRHTEKGLCRKRIGNPNGRTRLCKNPATCDFDEYGQGYCKKHALPAESLPDCVCIEGCDGLETKGIARCVGYKVPGGLIAK